MAEMTVEKLHSIIGALYATIAVHEQTIAEQHALIEQMKSDDGKVGAKQQKPSLLE